MRGIIDLFIPKEKKFFEYLNDQIFILDTCSKKLNEIFVGKKLNKTLLEKNLKYIQKKSEEADEISKEVINSLHMIFITPIDREEIKSLSIGINLMVDSLEKIINGIFYFKIEKIEPNFIKQLHFLEDSIVSIKHIFKEPLSVKRNRIHIEKIEKTEREADALYRQAIGELFNNGHTPVEIMKQRELYQIAEDAIDDAKYIGDILESVLINNS